MYYISQYTGVLAISVNPDQIIPGEKVRDEIDHRSIFAFWVYSENLTSYYYCFNAIAQPSKSS